MEVEGRRRKGRPKRRWMDRVNVDLTEKRRNTGQKHQPHIAVEKDAVEKEDMNHECNQGSYKKLNVKFKNIQEHFWGENKNFQEHF